MILLNILLIILALLLTLIMWALVVPVVFYVNTRQNIYCLRLVSMAKARFIFKENDFHIRISFLFMSFNIDPFKPPKKKKNEKEKKKKKPPRKKKIGKSFTAGKKMLGEFFRSFKIIDCHIEIDTGDVIKNAYLYPVSSILSNDKIQFSVNNNGTNVARIKIQNRLINFLFIFLRFYFRSK